MNKIKSGAKFFSSIPNFNFQSNFFSHLLKYVSMNILQSSTVWYGCVFWCRSNKSELFCCFRWFTLHSGRDFKINPKNMIQCYKRGCLIYILDSSNSSSITFWTSQLGFSSRSNWTGNSNGSWTDKQSSHFSTAKEMSVKATFFFR